MLFYGLLALSFQLARFNIASAFSFNTSTPTQCDQFTVQWDGGQEPFFLYLVPTIVVPGGHIQNISVPTGLSQPYSHSFTLNQPAGLEFLATMYDSTGFGSGGTTPVLTVGSGANGNCVDVGAGTLLDFTFFTEPVSNPAQCSSQTITWANNASYPVHLYGLIPSGTAFEIPVSQSASDVSVDWTVNIAADTPYLLAMSDTGQYQTGGSTNLQTVQSGSQGCMNSSSPSRGSSNSGQGQPSGTASGSGPSASVSGVGGSSSGGNGQDNNNSGSNSNSGSKPIGAIVGGTVGGVAFLVLLALLLFCCIRRKATARRDSESSDPALKSYGVAENAGGTTAEKRSRNPLDLLAPRRHMSDDSEGATGHAGAQGDYEPSPFRYPSPTGTRDQGLNQGQTLGALGAGGAAVGAGSLSGGKSSGGVGAGPTTRPTHAYTPSGTETTRPSMESTDTPPTTTTNSGAAAGTVGTAGHGRVPPSAWSDVNPGTDGGTVGTAGHGDGRGGTVAAAVQRHSSIAKPTPAPINTGTTGPSPADNAAAEVGAGRTSDVPGTPTRFVQHEDSGEVVDLPPRYDQLRTRNPDQV